MTPELMGLSVFFAFALGLGVWSIITGIAAVQQDADLGDELYSTSPFFKLAYPFAQYFGRTVGSLPGLEAWRKELRQKLVRAGKVDAISPQDFIGLLCVGGTIGLVIAAYFEAMASVGPALMCGIAMMCAFLPVMQLNDTIKKRQAAIRKLLPYTLDLLCLAVEAGLDFTAALNRIADNLRKSPFKDEIKVLSRDLSMGKTRGEALRDMDKRIGIEELTSVVSALVQADELGASLGPTLRIQSRELQRKRFQRAEKRAMQAPVLMLIPLVIFIFPLVFLIIFTPIVLKIIEMKPF